MDINPSLILVVAVIVAYIVSKGLRAKLATAKVDKLMAAGTTVTFLDVRTPAEHQERRIAGSVNAPLDQLQSVIGRLAPDKTAPLAVYCLSGSRAGSAVRILKGMGYSSLINIGAISAWAGEMASGKPQKKHKA